MAHIIFFVLFTLLWPTNIARASCCASSSAANVGRLSKHERASVSMQTVAQTTMGYFSNQARHQFGIKPNRPYFALLNSLELMTRVAPWLEPVVLIPSEIKWSSHHNGASLGDISAGARIGVFPYEYLSRLPTLALVMMAKAPSGQTAYNITTLPEEITSAGVWWALPSILIEKSVHDLVFGLNYGLEIPFKPAQENALWPGLKNNVALAISGPLAPQWMWSFSNLWSWQQATRFNHQSLGNTDKRKTNLSGALTWSIHSHIKVKSHVAIDMPVHFVGKNLPANFSLGLTLRIGVY